MGAHSARVPTQPGDGGETHSGSPWAVCGHHGMLAVAAANARDVVVPARGGFCSSSDCGCLADHAILPRGWAADIPREARADLARALIRSPGLDPAVLLARVREQAMLASWAGGPAQAWRLVRASLVDPSATELLANLVQLGRNRAMARPRRRRGATP